MARPTSFSTCPARTSSPPPSPLTKSTQPLTPMHSITSKPLFPQLLSFHIDPEHPGCPPLPPGRLVLREPPCNPLSSKSFTFSNFPPLQLSCPLFCRRHPLFSITSRLFSQNRGVGYPPSWSPRVPAPHIPTFQPSNLQTFQHSAQSLPASFPKTGGWGIPPPRSKQGGTKRRAPTNGQNVQWRPTLTCCRSRCGRG